MPKARLLKKLKIRNFKGIGEETVYDLSSGNYFVGKNNVGKSTILESIRFFFDAEELNGIEFLNRATATAKKAGARKSEITIVFDLGQISSSTLRQKLKADGFTNELAVTKAITLTRELEQTEIAYNVVGSQPSKFSDLPESVQKVVDSVKVNYLHPQRGSELLKEAEIKLRRRLLDNFGRGANTEMTRGIQKLESEWQKFRTIAGKYLSDSLNSSIENVWPGGRAVVALPQDVKEVLAISQINFAGEEDAPSFDLLAHGSGAQALILYFAHFVLDADKTLSRAKEHHVIWLVEEPESFLHADLIARLGNELSTDKWAENIQLFITTHSAIFLSKSRLRGADNTWNLLSTTSKPQSAPSNKWRREQIEQIGSSIGDSNFYNYFIANSEKNSVIIEDDKKQTLEAYKRSAIDIYAGAGGVSNVKAMIRGLMPIESTLEKITTFIVDNDEGLSDIRPFLQKEIAKSGEFSKYAVSEYRKIQVIVLPKDWAAENLFDEFEDFLNDCASKIYDIKTQTITMCQDTYLASTIAKLRRRTGLNQAEVLSVLRKVNDVKDEFWMLVEKKKLKISTKNTNAINKLLEN